MQGVLKERRASRDTVVGYYRVEAGEMLRLSPHDIELAERFFPAPSSVILLIHPERMGPPKAGFFHWDGGQLFGDLSLQEFPFDSALLDTEHRQETKPEPQPRAVPPRGALAEDQEENAPLRSEWAPRKIAAWSGAAFALAGMSVIAVWNIPKNLRSHSASPELRAAAAGHLRMDLRAERAGQDFRLTWNASSPAIVSAVAGLLSIQDARGHKEISLESNQLRSGSILYQPYGEQVQLQLSLLAADQSV
ncbi:MAG: hypothetical protein M3Z32_00270, partial [Acidobacteriota bacterium]|nr:hypothetical protein [Acidobacteriota bacterium]